MLAQYFAGAEKSSMLPLRLALGAVFIMHGARTLFVNGLPWLAGFLENLGVPAPMAFAALSSLIELAGGAALLLGAFTRLAALLLAGNMAVAFFLVHMTKGFFVTKGGFEFVMVLFAGCVSILLAGAGRPSIEHSMGRELP